MDKVKLLVKLKEQIKELTAQAKEIEKELLEQWIEKEQVDNYVITKTVRVSFKLKKNVDENEIMDKFPTVVKVSIDTKSLSKEPWANEYLDVYETEYLTVKKIKKWKTK